MDIQEPNFFNLEEETSNAKVNMYYLRNDFRDIFDGKIIDGNLVDFGLFNHIENRVGSNTATYFSHDKNTLDTLMLKVEQDLLTNEFRKKLFFRTCLELDNPEETFVIKKGISTKVVSIFEKVVCTINGPDGVGRYVDLISRDPYAELPSEKLSFRKTDIPKDEWELIQGDFQEFSGYFIEDMNINYNLYSGDFDFEVTLE